MLAHTLKKIIELVPETLPLVKQATIDADMPLDNKDSCLATALQLKYFEKIAYSPVDIEDLQKVAKAVHIYGLADTINDLTDKMVKSAQKRILAADVGEGTKETYRLKEAAFMGSGNCEVASELYKEAKALALNPSEEVTLYSGHAEFNKEAALKSLSVRFRNTGDNQFVKIARAIVDAENNKDERLTEPENLVKLAQYVTNLDNSLHLEFKGFNFFKEAFFKNEGEVKQAMVVSIAGTQCPYEKLEKLGKDRISSYIGEDVANEMDAGPANFKNVVETLPLDLQHVLLTMTRNV